MAYHFGSVTSWCRIRGRSRPIGGYISSTRPNPKWGRVAAAAFILSRHGLKNQQSCRMIHYWPAERLPAYVNAKYSHFEQFLWCCSPEIQVAIQQNNWLTNDDYKLAIFRTIHIFRETIVRLDQQVLQRTNSIPHTSNVKFLCDSIHRVKWRHSNMRSHSTISTLSGNTTYCVKLSREALSRYSNKIASVGLRNCPYYHHLIKKVLLQ